VFGLSDKIYFIISIFTILICAFPNLVFTQSAAYHEIARRNLHDIYYIEKVEPNILRMIHKESGMVKYVDISDHKFNFDNPPSGVQVIDLTNVDTTLYNQKYTRYSKKLLVGGAIGYPMVIGDFNNNGLIDFAGEYKIPINTELAECAIVEFQQDSTFLVKKVYSL
jgi:hypothetical protein